MEISPANVSPFEPVIMVALINGQISLNDNPCAIQLRQLGAGKGTAFLGMSAKIFARQIGGDHPPEPMPDWERPRHPVRMRTGS